MILIVPVGAMHVIEALRTFLFFSVRQVLLFQFGNGPRKLASSPLASRAFLLINLIRYDPNSMPCCES